MSWLVIGLVGLGCWILSGAVVAAALCLVITRGKHMEQRWNGDLS